MGKKAAKLAAKGAGQPTQIPWKDIDRDAVAFLVAPESPEKFFKEVWEQRPLHITSTPERAALFQRLASLPALLKVLHKRQETEGPLVFGAEVVAARYRDGERENLVEEAADVDTLRRLHDKERCTLQLTQPQRYLDEAWRLMAALEARLGCLVGSNAYLTPAGSQGLAPHHDDVELWVCQATGTKRWRLYHPLGDYQLPSAPSGDLPQGLIGEPFMEVELAPGDVLYMPRGTVHQAVAQSADSGHLTVSTYQRWTWGDMAAHLLQVGLTTQGEPECLPLAARRSLPPGLLQQLSLEQRLTAAAAGGGKEQPPGLTDITQVLRSIADKLEAAPQLYTASLYRFSTDFWSSRLPPHPASLPPAGGAPDLDSAIWCRARGYCCLMAEDGELPEVPPAAGGALNSNGAAAAADGSKAQQKQQKAQEEAEGEDEEEEEEEEEEEGLLLVSCLGNHRDFHMIHPQRLADEEEDSEQIEGDSDEEEDEEMSEGEQEAAAAAAGGGGGKKGGKKGAKGAGAAADAPLSKAAARRAKKLAAAAAAEAAEEEEDDGDLPEGFEQVTSEDIQAALGMISEDDASGDEQGHHHHHHGEECGEGCDHDHHGSEEESEEEGEGSEAQLPGMRLPAEATAAAVAFMRATSPDKAIRIRDLPLEFDSEKLQMAFALWAEGLAACVPAKASKGGAAAAGTAAAGAGGSSKQGKAGGGKAGGKAAAAGGAEGGQPSKKARKA